MTSNHNNPELPRKRAQKVSGTEQVAEFMETLEHPLKQEIETVRQIILGSHPQLQEHIKWNAPSFHYQGEDRITFNLRGKDAILLIFHRGAKVKDKTSEKPLIEDTTGLLEWKSTDRATVKLKDMEEINLHKENLVQTITKWLEIT